MRKKPTGAGHPIKIRGFEKPKPTRELESLTLRDVIDALASGYKFKYSEFPHNLVKETFDLPLMTELVVDDEKLVLINERLGIEHTRSAIVHAFIHIKHFLRGDLPHKGDICEDTVNAETDLTFKELYGIDPPEIPTE
ncbi:hypothetical protein ACFL1O_00330 [Patescibacteria group bacterium]